MYKKLLALTLFAILSQGALTGCSSTGSADSQSESRISESPFESQNTDSSDANQSDALQDGSGIDSKIEGVASSDEMTTIEDVVEDDMVPVSADQLVNGVYSVTVDSSSSMFKIEDCTLAVSDDSMSAVMTMAGTGYLYVFMGTGEEAVKADETEYIPFEETSDGAHTFTIPVEALDKGIACTAYSKRKEQWYDRTLVFRADSLPLEAFGEELYTDVADLNLQDGTYTAEVTLSGGSGRASVTSPARIFVSGEDVTAEIIWSSPNYDFMEVNGERFDPVNEEGNSTFIIPVNGFDYKMQVGADTTAMSTPYLINYTLTFDSSTLKAE